MTTTRTDDSARRDRPAMTAAEYRAAIARLGLSQVKAGHLLGVDPRTSRAYALGERPVPYVVALALGLMLAMGVRPEDIDPGPPPAIL